jgi:hypothetical protein
MVDFASFFFIFLVFILAFGVSIKAILTQPNENESTLKSLINIVYWPIYGDIRLLDKLEDCFKDAENCKNLNESNASLALLMIYMYIANVLLLNILIAMFR